MPKRYAIRVTFASGDEAFLRHGSRIGYGPVATFGTRKLADINAEMICNGLDAGDIISVIEWKKSVPAGATPSEKGVTESAQNSSSSVMAPACDCEHRRVS